MPYFNRDYKPKTKSSRAKTRSYKRTTQGRMQVVGKNRGYLRTGGYYGRYNKRRSDGEVKFWDVAQANFSPLTTGNIKQTLIDIPDGTNESSRLGRKALIKSLNFHCNCIMPAVTSGAASYDRIRFIVWLDKQSNGAAPLATDILETADIYSFNNLANSQRFKILKDAFFDMGGVGGGAPSGAAYVLGASNETKNFYLKCSIPVEYNGTTGALGEIRSNNIGCLLISEANRGTIGYTCRVRFTG